MKDRTKSVPSISPAPSNHDELVLSPTILEEEEKKKEPEMINTDLISVNESNRHKKVKEEQLLVPIVECRALSQHDLCHAFQVWCKLSQRYDLLTLVC
jgi:hypothetical protein